MAERRPLIEGIKPATPAEKELEQQFVYGGKSQADADRPADPKPSAPDPSRILPQISNRVPITTRTRPEVASALKRASLQRQLESTPPYYVQDIMEEALESWLRTHGYLD